MRKKIVWSVVSGLMVLALVLASCGPAVTEEEEEEVVTEEEEEEEVAEEEEEEEGPEMVVDAMGRLVEKPKYGGVFIMGWGDNIRIFDQIFGHPWWVYANYITHNVLLEGDWAKGPAGSGDTDWRYNVFPELGVLRPVLAESWEMVDDTTQIYYIRKGVHFRDKPPANGREMTAEDVAFSIRRLFFPEAVNIYISAQVIESVEATDKYTVVIKSQPGQMGVAYRHVAHYPRIHPKDALELYGDMNDWKNSNGTGPFMLTDFVRDSSATFIRNPNYWDYDPLHPQNQLPYLDGVKYLIIPDASTRLAALRTAKIDILGVGWEDGETLLETNPELVNFRTIQSMTIISFRVDKPELPWHDKRVRQALYMATNHEEIAAEYYGGNADIEAYPVLNIPAFSAFFVPMEERAEIVQDMFGYHPDKARQLLAEAGYPDGFKATVLMSSTSVDLLSVVKAYWAEVGVELIIDAREYGTFIGAAYGRQYDIVLWSADNAGPQFMSRQRTGHADNAARVEDPIMMAAYAEISNNFFNADKKAEIYREIHPYILEQANYLALPAPAWFLFWQPWVKNYHGEIYVGTWAQRNTYPQWIWIDQDMKEAMTGRR